jgi:HD-GYP domain-containing protein (c-di-GMP phosphodiesterase class II)
MNLVPVNAEAIRIGHPLPFALRNESGVLLATKGFVLRSPEELDQLVGTREQVFVDLAESESHRRAYVSRLHDLVRDEKPLGKIAESQFASFEQVNARDANDADLGEPDWLDLQAQANTVLRDTNPATFTPRLNRLYAQLSRHTQRTPDGTLFALFYLSSGEMQLYSATHAMLVSVMCALAAREVLKWPAEQEASLCKAALTMNIGMTELQDRLAQQRPAPTPEQTRHIQQHPLHSVRLLEQLGVTDQNWLEAVLDHHAKLPGPLGTRSLGERMARLIQRADVFAARLSPRASRACDSPASAMKSTYFDENRDIDEAGAAIIKAVGIYSPGSFVRLASNEIAAVVKRGANTTTPRVAVLVNRTGMPTGELILRDTSQPDYRILSSVPHREVKVKISLPRLLALAKPSAADSPW